jgi:hypothetical protein
MAHALVAITAVEITAPPLKTQSLPLLKLAPALVVFTQVEIIVWQVPTIAN